MKSRIIFLVIIFMFSLKGVAQWVWLNPLPQGNDLHSVFALDKFTCWTAGSFGTVMKTIDGGSLWTVVNTGIIENINSIWFNTSDNGWISCNGGKILNTLNGGNSWNLQYEGSEDLRLNSITFTDPHHGCAVGGMYYSSIILMTWDKGKHWIYNYLEECGVFMDVCFPDSLHGWAVTFNGRIFATNDSGANWYIQLEAGEFTWFKMLHFTDSLHGWALEIHSNNLYITEDGGISWTTKHLSSAIEDLYFVDSSIGYICGWLNVDIQYHGWVKKSINGGNSWSNPKWVDTSFLYALDFVSENEGWTVGSSGAIYRTLDGNQTWTRQTSEFTHQHLIDASFLQDGALGWIAASNGEIIHSEDYGVSWEIQPTGVTYNVNSIDFIDPLNGWACCDYGKVIHTMDGGTTWDTVAIPTAENCNSLSVLTEDKVIIVCQSGIILITTDQGFTWSSSVPVINSDLFSVCFTDTLHGWATGFQYGNYFNAFIAKTADGGLSWDTVSFDSNYFLYSVFFIDEYKGWAVGTNRIVMRTTDGGLTWETQRPPDVTTLRTVYFIDEYNGIIGSDDGILLTSYDGGVTYQNEPSGTDEYIFSLFANSQGDVWSAGMNGCILYYPNLIAGNTDSDKSLSTGYLHVYPNPFSEYTTLLYSLPEAGDVMISIYALNGNKMATVLHEIQEKGDHQIRFSNSILKPGIYICELKTHSRSLTGKMIILP